MEEEKIRLYVGGFPSDVSAGDLHERFAPLGNVTSITIPSAKSGPGHRGFAYVDFVPASDASLRKLFSAYNGCKWRGGLLRIEKAKEHFSDRLRREWAIEAASLTKDRPLIGVGVVQQSALASFQKKEVKGANSGDVELGGINIFFPKLKKVRPVPLTGLGKHKRSFERVETSPLHLLLTCACEQSLGHGSCNCSNINDGVSPSKEVLYHGNDDIAQAIEMERQRQLELLNKLFPSDSTSISLENQEVVELDSSEQQDEGPVGSAEKISPERTFLLTITDRVEPKTSTHSQQTTGFENPALKRRSQSSDSKLDSGNEETVFKDDSTSTAVATERAMQLELVHRLFPSDSPSTREPEVGTVADPEASKVRKKQKLNGAKSGADLGEPQSMAKVNTDTLSEDDMVLNVGDDSLSLAIAEEQEKAEVKSLSVRASELASVSEMTRHLNDNSLSFSNTEVRGRRTSANSQNVTLGDGLEDSEMILNLGNEFVPRSIAEQQERALVRSFSAAKRYNWTRKDGSSVSEDHDYIEENESEEDHLDYSRDAEQGDEDEDSESEDDTLGEQGDSDRSIDVEDSEIEELSSEEQDDSLDNKDHSESISLMQTTTNTKLAEASLQRRDGAGSVGKQLDKTLKWAALADMCQFRTESTVQSEEEKLEENTVLVASSEKREDVPSVLVSALQVDESKASSQQQTDADNVLKPNSSGQKLTRAAWKSLVGETGRVVFSLRQLTGSNLPQTPPLSQKPQGVEDTQTQVEPSGRSEKKTKFRLATVTAPKTHVGALSTSEPKLGAAKLPNVPVFPSVSSNDVCPFMKSENAEKEWLATKSELRLDYRAKQKYAKRNVKKLRGSR